MTLPERRWREWLRAQRWASMHTRETVVPFAYSRGDTAVIGFLQEHAEVALRAAFAAETALERAIVSGRGILRVDWR